MYVNADEEKAMHSKKQTHAHETSAEEKKPTQRKMEVECSEIA